MPTINEVYRNSLNKLKNRSLEEINVRILLCYVNHLSSMSDFFVNKEQEVASLGLFDSLFEQYLKGYPVQYLTHEASFLGNTFYVDENVLIPRMETEEVVSFAIELIRKTFPNKSNLEIADICTGSGCIGLTLASIFKTSTVFLSDISESALNVAKKNGAKMGLDNTTYYLGETLDPVLQDQKTCDVIVSNPPYIISKNNVDESTFKYEPHLALFTDENASIYEKIIRKSLLFGNSPLLLVFEISDEVKPILETLVNEKYPEAKSEFKKDMNGHFRIFSLLFNK